MTRTVRARFLFDRREVRGVNAPLASATKDGVSLRSDAENAVWNPGDDVSLYKLVEPDDFVIGLRSFQHGLARSQVRGLVSPAYTVLRARTKDVVPGYFAFYFRSAPLIAALDNLSQGIRQGRTIPYEPFSDLRFPVPSGEEQCRIAAFLDDQTLRLDRALALRQQQVDMLEARLQSTIDSLGAGIHRSLVGAPRIKAGHLIRVLPGYAFPSSDFSTTTGQRLLRGINVGVRSTSWNEVVYWTGHDPDVERRFSLQVGSVVMGMDRPWIGAGLRITRLTEEDLPALLLQRVAHLIPGPRVDAAYMCWAFQARRFRTEVEGQLTGLSVPHLSGEQISAYRLPIPDMPTQERVATELDDLASATASARAALARSQALLMERKQTLITAAVTGQFDVTTARAVA
ncbi:hypothetical protein QOZ88_17940 [Blastococcus sp. BMG 814]|uniref:Type I restriction enzyme, S subunit n=1 Tax=Blastococcus carthaginiensis TaxID=3050034 RepID=A0ABT9IG19_9ACTN|nr:hypothetical protein [Blastococcus carthaginiensis]MDP5184522.1 hypothetical protein [Blastococcus carthaginiensis]